MRNLLNQNVGSVASESAKSFLERLKWGTSPLRFEIQTFLMPYPTLYLAISRWRFGYSDTALGPDSTRRWAGVVQRDTEIVIEGFGRSANTFAAVAFRLSQPRVVKIAYRLHTPAQVIAGARMNVPCLVIIREPEGAVLSKAISRPVLTLRQILRAYLRFYGCLLPYRDRFVVATFDEVVSDFGAVVRKVNDRFGTRFEEFHHTEANTRKCFEIIDKYYGRKGRGFAESNVSRPSEERKNVKDALRSQFHSDDLAEIRTMAYRLYDRLTSDTDRSPAAKPRIRSYWYYLSPWNIA